MGTDLTAQLHPIAIPEQLWDRGTHLEVTTASLMGSALGIFAIFLYKHVGAKAYVAEIPHPDNITFLSPEDERKYWPYAAIWTLVFRI